MPDEDDFNKMLRWLNPDLDLAGELYEQIRVRLIRIFVGRSCYVAEELADRTIIRVASKSDWLIENFEGNPALYFYGVANHIFHEWRREEEKKNMLPKPEPPPELDSLKELRADCLEGCLNKHSVDQRSMVLGYFSKDKRAKIEHRKQMAIDLGITINALHIRVCRIKVVLEKCIDDCVLAGAH